MIWGNHQTSFKTSLLNGCSEAKSGPPVRVSLASCAEGSIERIWTGSSPLVLVGVSNVSVCVCVCVYENRDSHTRLSSVDEPNQSLPNEHEAAFHLSAHNLIFMEISLCGKITSISEYRQVCESAAACCPGILDLEVGFPQSVPNQLCGLCSFLHPLALGFHILSAPGGKHTGCAHMRGHSQHVLVTLLIKTL